MNESTTDTGHGPALPDGAGDGTRAVRAGLPEPVKHEPTLPGPVFAAHFHLPGDPTGPYTYGRDENPTWTLLERAVGELEAPGQDGVETLVFASGMAAISSVLFSQLRAGDAVVLPDDGYQALPLVRAQLETYGIEVRTAPTGGDAQLEVLDGAKLLWIETPSNPGLDVCDVRRLAEAAHARGALVAVDNTLATPLGQRPLELGADFAVASGTKQLTGHGDVLLGYVVGRDAEAMAAVRRWRKIVGAIPGPMEAWLAHRSIATLQLRVDRQNATALTLARALRERSEVTGLRYPGLPDDPSHTIASQQMRGFGCVVSFTLPSRERADRFLGALRLVDDATSFGGVRSTAERRGRWGGDAVPEGFIRFSVGAEDPEDLVADVLRALDESAV
ncbi:cystathionine gamma-lyase [Streptomyces virens]|jgi:cystathionine gamma-lyase|uniref:Cystathionine gamma-lyase n=2 Tax=Streptomyces TaxID=1883 RepID=A0A514JR61_9ACTN|nr:MULTISPECIES: cystathionine gamma-lyase [Streptomyces]MBA8977340.1 cystathionine gamma-lyase [Streptomyces calvus]MYS28739.1 cystathionine gamma-lyase [Streptomyces sp. SID7804]QDI69843.1 cystathionine gamma-lyase [Streptomyces calvus]